MRVQLRRLKIQVAVLNAVYAMVLSVGLGFSQTPKTNIGSAKEHPNNAIGYRDVAAHKLASRKTAYRRGEFVVLDLAVRNTSKSEVFFLSDFSIEFQAWDRAGRQIHVSPYGILERVVNDTSFTLTEPDDFIVVSALILIGCDKGMFEGRDAMRNPRESFDQNRFVSRGSACLGVTSTGAYSITAKFTNTSVVLSTEGNAKTAVGTVKTDPLVLLVTK